MGKNRFLALEGPRTDLVPFFFNLLVNHHVTHLVRLTPAKEGNLDTCAPYWENKVIKHENGSSAIQIPQSTQGTGKPYQIPYYAIDDWLDYGSGTPEQLLTLVKTLKKSVQETKDPLIAIHCSSGVSRTGTVMAAYLLLQDIDKKIRAGVNPKDLSIDIEKTVAQLSLQRPHAVGKPMQYVTLYRMVDLYVDKLRER